MPFFPTTLASQPHRRFNPLTREWILVSPQRTQRPWLGLVEPPPPDMRPAYDPECYLCPGNTRAGGIRNPDYTSTFVFDNDFAALVPDVSSTAWSQGELLTAQGERGICRVVVFSPRHDLTIAAMDVPAIRQVVDVWSNQFQDLGSRPWINSVLVFENRGAMMGASNMHPHGQIWAEERIPVEPAKELASCADYLRTNGVCLLCSYLTLELDDGQRIVCSNDHFVVLVPFWAVWPFETLVLPRRHVDSISGLSPAERDGLADILKRLTTRYDNLFGTSFPYSMGFHQRPTDGQSHPEVHLHAHYFPPLLRSATVRKFMVGYELLANPQRDLTAETAAERLRETSEVHL